MKKYIYAFVMLSLLGVVSCDDGGSDSGLEDLSTFKIASVADFLTFADSVAINNAFCAELAQDIDLKDEEWTPINIYSGTLDGKNYKISGLKVDGDSDGQGFFVKCDGATIANLTIEGSVYNSAGESTGLFAGYAYNSCFYNCATTASSTVEGLGNNSAGIVGFASGSLFENCMNLATVKGSRYSAGIVAYTDSNSSCTFDGCSNGGAISDANATSSKYEYIGGIVARLNGSKVRNCVNSGSITGGEYGKYTGGIVGHNTSGGSISDCNNTGIISSSNTHVGGIVGTSDSSSTVSGCNNEGVTEGSSYVAGIVGYNNKSTISGCNNEAAVSGSSNLGGITGYNFSGSSIYSCSNNGTVTGVGNLGGIAGKNYNSIIAGCYNTAAITGNGSGSSTPDNYYITGVSGYNSGDGVIINCYNTGEVICTNGFSGGITSTISSASVINCYNLGAVRVNGSGTSIGGIAYNISGGTLLNCYNASEVTSSGSTSTLYRGAILGSQLSADTNTIEGYYNTDLLSNGFGTASDQPEAIVGMTTAEMQLDSFIETLNNNVSAYNLDAPDVLAQKWVKGGNGYPTFGE